jgi:arsenate reductase
MTIKILHNPACSKSRATLQILKDQGIEPQVILYLETPPDAEQLKSILMRLGRTARELMRSGEDEYTLQGLSDPNLSEEALIDAMVRTPRLIERPIVIAGENVAIGRPPQAILAIL